MSAKFSQATVDVSAEELAAGRARALETLEGSGITPTPQRLEIARILLARPRHLSAEQILAALRQGDLTVSKATVYNTLGLFARKGLVREVTVDASKVFYDSNCCDHHHFYDADSGTLIDIDANDVAIGELPELPADKVVDRIDVIVRVRSASE